MASFFFSSFTPQAHIIFPQPIAYAAVVPEKSTYLTLEEVKTLTKKYADKYHIEYNSFLQTILCEAPRVGAEFDPFGQSENFSKDGSRELSFGLPQIHLPSHPEITKDEAQDADWSIEWSAQQFSKGKQNMWTCWLDLKASGKI